MLELKKFIVIILYLSLVILGMPCFASDAIYTDKAFRQQTSGNQDVDNVDFEPYIKEIMQTIKTNWNPPHGTENNKVVVLFKVAKDGRLLSSRIFKSSGNPDEDRAALKAIEDSAPFKAFPYKAKKNSIDIEFTFTYKLFRQK